MRLGNRATSLRQRPIPSGRQHRADLRARTRAGDLPTRLSCSRHVPTVRRSTAQGPGSSPSRAVFQAREALTRRAVRLALGRGPGTLGEERQMPLTQRMTGCDVGHAYRFKAGRPPGSRSRVESRPLPGWGAGPRHGRPPRGIEARELTPVATRGAQIAWWLPGSYCAERHSRGRSRSASQASSLPLRRFSAFRVLMRMCPVASPSPDRLRLPSPFCWSRAEAPRPTGARQPRNKSTEQKAEAKFADFAKCLREHGVDVELISHPGGGHGLKLSRGNDGPAASRGSGKGVCALPAPTAECERLAAAGSGTGRTWAEVRQGVREHGIKLEVRTSGNAARMLVGGREPSPDSPAFQRAMSACGGPKG